MDEETRKRFFSSKDQSWATPQDFFNKINKIFKFKLDPCATPRTAKCKKYFTKYEDGLKQDWKGGGSVFVNPPYSRALYKWCKKCYDESSKNIIVMLIPARTDTRYFHDFCFNSTAILFIKGRLKFIDMNSKISADKRTPAFFPSALIIFGKVKANQLKKLEKENLGELIRLK